MKTEFEFFFQAGNAEIREPVSVNFAASGRIAVRRHGEVVPDDVQGFRVEVKLNPEKKQNSDGSLFLTIQGTFEEHSLLAKDLASDIAQHLAFYYEGFQLLHGFLMAKRIPETPEEAEAVGDKVYTGEINLIEVGGPLPFNRYHLRMFPYSLGLMRTLRQFNAARSTRNPIDAYLGMFKVIETLFYRGKKKTAEVLRGNTELRELCRESYRTSLNDEPFRKPNDEEVGEFVGDLVAIRDRCAHLREGNSFGFAPQDRGVFDEVKPSYDFIEAVARSAIQRRLDAAKGPEGHSTKLSPTDGQAKWKDTSV